MSENAFGAGQNSGFGAPESGQKTGALAAWKKRPKPMIAIDLGRNRG
jgi:hypothetical protein